MIEFVSIPTPSDRGESSLKKKKKKKKMKRFPQSLT